MEVYTIDSSNVSSALTELKKGGKHFIIMADVNFPKGVTYLGPGSILAFRGGSFVTITSSTVVLESCQICAGSYPVFHKNIRVVGLENAEVRAEWFRSADDDSDADFINRAIKAANGCPVVLEARTYTLKDSIRFKSGDNSRQTLICPGTLQVSGEAGNIPAVDINVQTVTLKVKKIKGTATADGYNGIGVKFSVYTEHSDIEVDTMINLDKGFFVQPDMRGQLTSEGKQRPGGVQYCRIRFGSISADYCFYIDVYTTAPLVDSDTGKPVVDPLNLPPGLENFSVYNWFNENQISGELMQGKYGVYTVDLSEWETDPIVKTKVSNVMNGLMFENISFERITVLALRLRSVRRSSFLNMQMFNSMPGGFPNSSSVYTPWIDLENISEVRMSFNSYVVPNRIKVGDSCKNTYIHGAILDNPEHYYSHFDTLGIDTLPVQSGNSSVTKSQMFVTNSVVPFNMTKNVATDPGEDVWVTTKYISDLLPNLKDDNTNSEQISLPVLPSTVNVEVGKYKTMILNLTGLDLFAPCLFTVNASMLSGGKLQFRVSDYLKIEGGEHDASSHVNKKTFADSGTYSVQWLSNWVIRITKL